MKNIVTTSIFLILYLLCIGVAPVSAQKPGRLKQILPERDSISREIPFEKIHIHFDRSYYSAGDTIWFKSYLADRSNQLTEHSQVLYVTLLDETGAVVQSVKIPNGSRAGLGRYTAGPGAIGRPVPGCGLYKLAKKFRRGILL